ncbi:MAG: beta,2-mannobiose phosphorylase / 1,2-beta-oligomannan phosphorylase [Patescibacteria group bacterium]|nr:beta,2-mannobiose phosphorylase / 1,2-beta-oligomannan phosphorylase [Patescibacteria group bacterium]
MAVHKKTDSGYVYLGIFQHKGKIGLLEKDKKQNTNFWISWSEDGTTFERDNRRVFFSFGLKNHKPDQCSNFRFSNSDKKTFVAYTRTIKNKDYRVVAEARNPYEWEVVSETPSLGYESVIVPDKINKNYVMYEGGSFVRCLVSKDLEGWNDNNTLLFTTRYGFFDRDSVTLIGTYVSTKGLILIYSSLEQDGKNYRPHIGAVLLDENDPYKILWRFHNPLWKSDIVFSKNTEYRILGMISSDDDVHVFFCTDNIMITVCLDVKDFSLKIPAQPSKLFIKHKKNPILSPHSAHHWESQGSLNPATIMDDKGHVHLLYRAIGSDGVSRIGYNFSKDGIHFDDRQSDPIFAMRNPRRKIKEPAKKYDPVMYPSGGSWGGCEDPRAVRIDGRVYVTFNAFDGWDFLRIAVISMAEKDFFKRNWKWSSPILISPEKEVHKNWVLFPEKIGGKFAILHSISPKIQIDYVKKIEDLDEGPQTIKSNFKQDATRAPSWDSWVRGVGPPPIRTKYGWLVLYHAMDHGDPNKYKLGAMLLDLKNPEKVIARSNQPLISPDKWYENDWKPGVVYACGALVRDGVLFVYYGGGDKHVCVATASIDEFLTDLIKHK